MFYKEEFIGKYFCGSFLQVGAYDEDELIMSGESNEKNVSLELDAVRCLRFFPTVENLILRPGNIDKKDLQYLHGIPVKVLKLDYYSDMYDEYSINLGCFKQLEYVFSRTQYNFKNIQAAAKLTKLVVQQWSDPDLRCLQNTQIVSLELMEGKLKSFTGIDLIPELKELSISNQRLLRKLSSLENCHQLQVFKLESSHAADLQTIPRISTLKLLSLIGRQIIEDTTFFNRFPSLEKIIIGVKILDGNLSSFLKLNHCVLLKEYSHYSHKNSQLPKG